MFSQCLPLLSFPYLPSLCSNKESNSARDCQQILVQRQEHGLISGIRFTLAFIHPWSHSRRSLTVLLKLVFISALRIKNLLILAARLALIDYPVICLRFTIQSFLTNCWTACMGRAASGNRAITWLLKGTTQTGYLLSSRVFSKLRAKPYLVSISGQEVAHHFIICFLFWLCRGTDDSWKQRLENQPSDSCCFCLVVGQIIGGLLGIVVQWKEHCVRSPKIRVLVLAQLAGYSPWCC